jgi:hypothetical protein
MYLQVDPLKLTSRCVTGVGFLTEYGRNTMDLLSDSELKCRDSMGVFDCRRIVSLGIRVDLRKAIGVEIKN